MAIEKEVTKEAKDNAIDMLIMLIVDELTTDLQMDPDEAFSKFVSSKTGQLLYDEESKFWWSGPSDIVEMFKVELQQAES